MPESLFERAKVAYQPPPESVGERERERERAPSLGGASPIDGAGRRQLSFLAPATLRRNGTHFTIGRTPHAYGRQYAPVAAEKLGGCQRKLERPSVIIVASRRRCRNTNTFDSNDDGNKHSHTGTETDTHSGARVSA